MPQQLKSHDTLPSESDFDPFGGCLDAQHAWRQFGGLALEDAYAKFIEGPIFYQEDFMFMGGRAFAFYFPVLDRYLQTYRVGEGPGEKDDSYAAIIGAGFSTQLASPTSRELDSIRDHIRSLAEYVRSHLGLLAEQTDEQRRIDNYWQILQTQLPP